MPGRGRPRSEEADRRERMLATKVNKAEGQAWDDLLADMGVHGPLPREADALRWLIVEECKRRGIAWPGAKAATPAKAEEVVGQASPESKPKARKRAAG